MPLTHEKAVYYGLKGGSIKAKHTLDVIEAKKLFIAKVHENLLPIFQALYDKAITGDVSAIKELLDRSWGKAIQGVEVSGKDGSPVVFMPIELIDKHKLQVAQPKELAPSEYSIIDK